jgi:integrase
MSFDEPGGRDHRQRERQAKHHRSMVRLAYRFDQWKKELVKPEWKVSRALDLNDYTKLVSDIRRKIADGEFAPSENMRLLRLLSTFSAELINMHDLLVSPVSPPVTLGRNESRRTLSGFHQFIGLRAWNIAFEERLIAVAKLASPPQTLLGLTLWSAIARGTLCNPLLLRALHDRLILREPCLERSFGGQLTIRLAIPAAPEPATDKKSSNPDGQDGRPTLASANEPYRLQRANQYEKETAVRIHRWTPDAVTLALIHRCLESEGSFTSGEQTINTIRHALWEDGQPQPNHLTLAALCRHSIWLADDRTDLRYSESLGEVARGKWASLGLDDIGHALSVGQVKNLRNSSVTPVVAAVSRTTTSTTIDWTWYEKIQSAVARIDNRSPRRTTLLETLEAIKLECPITLIEHVIISWLIHLLSGSGPVATSTIATYHSRISHRLIDAFDGQSINDLDSADFELIYRSIVDQVRTTPSREQIAGRIGQLHDFGLRSRDHNLPPLVDPLFTGLSVKMVRARVIPANCLTAIFAALPPLCEHNAVLIETVTQAIVIAYRCGLRLGEIVKLRLCDIEQSREKTLFVVENAFGTNKTASARRQLPLAAMLTDDERTAFGKFEKRRRLTGTARAPAFAVPASHEPVSDKWLSQTAARAMRHALGAEGWTFHHLRHAAINNLFLVVEDEAALAETLSGWSSQQQQSILKAVLGDVRARQKRYIAMATFAGHVDPQETFESYIHVVEHVMAARRGRQSTEAELNLYAAALNRAPGRITHYATDQVMSDAVAARMRRWIVKHRSDKRAALVPVGDSRTEPMAAVPTSKILPADCIVALQIVERGGTFEEAAMASLVDASVVETWVERATRLAALTTKYGNPRLFTIDRVNRAKVDPAMRVMLLPTLPKGSAHTVDCDAMFKHFRKKWADKQTREECEWWLQYTIEKADPANSGTAFTDANMLIRYFTLFEGSSFPADRWHLDMNLADHIDSLPWLACLPKGVTNSDPRPKAKRKPKIRPVEQMAKGNVRLHLNKLVGKGSTPNVRYTKSTASTVRFVAHILAIMTGATLSDPRPLTGA